MSAAACDGGQRSPTRQPLRLAHISEAFNVPIVVVTACSLSSLCQHWAFGLDTQFDRLALASVLHKQCGHGTAIIPDIAVHPGLSPWSRELVNRGLRCMTGVSLMDESGRHAGSISVLTGSGGVAGKGVYVGQLRAYGHQFIAQML